MVIVIINESKDPEKVKQFLLTLYEHGIDWGFGSDKISDWMLIKKGFVLRKDEGWRIQHTVRAEAIAEEEEGAVLYYL